MARRGGSRFGSAGKARRARFLRPSRKPFISAVYLALALSLSLGQMAGAEQLTRAELAQRIEQLIRARRAQHTLWGIHIVDLQTGETVYSKNADLPLVPASNAKLFTTATALARLGPEYRFTTTLYAAGKVDRAVLKGDLVLVGKGDPDLLESTGEETALGAINRFARQVVAYGIKEIEGDVIGDDSYFGDERFLGSWRDKDRSRYYAPPVSALSINKNVIRLEIRPGRRIGQRPTVKLYPTTSYIKIENRASTGSRRSRSSLRVVKKPGSVYIYGRIPMRRPYYDFIVVDNPARFAATLLLEALGRLGVRVGGSAKSWAEATLSPDRSNWIELASIQSQPLAAIIDSVNKESQNLYAELLLRAVGAELWGEGTTEAGLRSQYNFLSEIGIREAEAILADGSGLSRNNLVTARSIVHLLEYVYHQDYFKPFYESLPISGVDGTLRHRFNRGDARWQIRAKTGTLADAMSLSGYINTNYGKIVVFSIIANRFSTSAVRIRSVIDGICELIVRYY